MKCRIARLDPDGVAINFSKSFLQVLFILFCSSPVFALSEGSVDKAGSLYKAEPNKIIASKAFRSEIERIRRQIITNRVVPKFDGPTENGCLSNTDCNFGLTVGTYLLEKTGKVTLLILESNTNRKDSRGNTIWQVEDVIAYKDNMLNHLTEIDCTSSNRLSGLLAVGHLKNLPSPKSGWKLEPIKRAWRADVKLRKFIDHPVNDIVCETGDFDEM